MDINLEKAALFESLNDMIDDIESIFRDYGYDPSEFDEGEFESGEIENYDIAEAYSHVNKLKRLVE